MKLVQLFLGLSLLCAQVAYAGGLDLLDQFIKTTKNGRAEFVQTVTLPARHQPNSRSGASLSGADAKSVGKVKISRGTFEFLRPNRFKFVYTKPFEQTIVADGQTLWLYDVDLNQVTSRKLAAVMGGSPAALFASAPNLQALQANFELQALNHKDAQDVEWIVATPKTRPAKAAASQAAKSDATTKTHAASAAPSGSDEGSSLLQSVKVGFKQTSAGVEIAALEMVDSFGQVSVVRFDKVQINTNLSAADFEFKPPKGVDVLKQ